MYYLMSTLAAIIIAVMIVVNGELTLVYGTYIATIIIHVVGLTLASVILAVKRESPFQKQKLRKSLYLGGVIGVATTMFNNMAFGKISVSLIIALGLLGQTITALIIDEFGLFNMPVKKFNKAKLIGLLFVFIGIACLLPGSKIVVLPCVLSLLTGVSIITARSINAQLAQKTSVFAGTWFNYATGLIFAVILTAFAGGAGILPGGGGASPEPWFFLGGVIGLLVVVLCNIATNKMPAFHMTLILFAGQIFTGILLDVIILRSFSAATLAGGIFATLGLSINVWLDNKNPVKS